VCSAPIHHELIKGEKMSRTAKTKPKRRLRKRTWVWMLSALLAVGGLLYWDQVAWLYVLGTLALTIFMLVVAFSNLDDEGGEVRDTDAVEPISAPVPKAANSRGKTTREIYSTE
jgi:hypothetical protein